MKREIRKKCEHCGGKGGTIVPNPEWLRKMREIQGLSLREVARRLHVSAAFLSDVELGNRKPNTAILKWYGF